ncbi:isochorismatase family protein [Bradymonadaceae bacterium TMQ3]|uniref:Isochorismatase family protein n=1 Tax=Lujinxingia sediminis TaxID=2480984 RepID=A0ABY0CQI1_9DELT|nr:isochorismatase family protein [Lujinxingia sediminis]RDV37925.1 isochorismatase family protein [Bradymonadaceae bacterium TMQ3]RVU42747.1 isochorismatase family protein [Lujinxingia sediminis]TXC75297.1 isochorismatase family protein [Bradymonadales bacterium TMQ1]
MTDIYLGSKSALLVVDVQERLLKAMPEPEMERCLHATKTLVELAQEVGAQIVYTEQYPRGLGPTEASLLQSLNDAGAERVEKMTFDACAAPEFHRFLIELPKRIVVCGMEAHICVQATVRALLEHRHRVFVPFDAVISRRLENRDNGLRVMEQAGAVITNYETVVFDALRSAEHPAFKRFSKMVR